MFTGGCVGGHTQDRLLQNPIFQDVEGTVSHILQKVGCRSKCDVVEELMSDVESDLMRESRDVLFTAAVGLYDEQLEANGISGGKAKVELKNRRGDNANEKVAYDMVNLVIYVCGLEKFFPRDVLSSKSTYIDIEPETPLTHLSPDNSKIPC